jgi:hypothetical protein
MRGLANIRTKTTNVRLWLLGLLLGWPGTLPYIGAYVLMTLPLLGWVFARRRIQ